MKSYLLLILEYHHKNHVPHPNKPEISRNHLIYALRKIQFENTNELIQKEIVIKMYEEEVQKYNSFFSHFEQIKKFELLDKPWTPETGELTATLKLKRRNVLEKYNDLYKKIFSY